MKTYLKHKKIPNLDSERLRINFYKNVKIDFQNKIFNESFIDVREMGLSGKNYYYEKDNPPYYQKIEGSIKGLFLRKSIVEKLIRVNQKLSELGLELYFYDCYRPIAVQYFFYKIWYPNYLKKCFPNLSEEQILQKRNNYIAKCPTTEKGVDKNAPPPHITGAAMDMTLRFISTKEHLFMGTIFDDFSEIVHTDYFEKISQERSLTLSEEEALKNRRLLFWIMKDAGFENYPFEWWHYSYGDQMWSVLNNKKAIYSIMKI